MSMSLDDIIKQTKQTRGPKRGGRQGQNNARGSNLPRRGGGNRTGRVAGGGIVRRRPGAGIPPRQTPYSRVSYSQTSNPNLLTPHYLQPV